MFQQTRRKPPANINQLIPCKPTGAEKGWCWQFQVTALALLVVFCTGPQAHAASNRSTYIPYGCSYYPSIVYDQVHQQIFTAWYGLDRIDVLSAVDYHLIRSITVPSPSSLDISPDGTTLAVTASSAHILFFDTGTFAKTNDIVFPDAALGVTTFLYTANGNAFVRAQEGLSTGGGITAYWDSAENSFLNLTTNVYEGSGVSYQTTGPLARSGDYSKILLGDATSGGGVQIIDGNTGQTIQTLAYFDSYIDALAANKDASRYAICLEPAGYANILLILDSNFNEIYQDEAGCLGMTFSADGNTLYREIEVNGVVVTQALNMTTFSSTTTTNSYDPGGGAMWLSADNTGMVYGTVDTSSTTVFVAVDTTASSTPAIPTPNDPVQIVRVIDNIGSPQGGDLIRILCTGVDTVSASSVSVTIGGQAATNLAVAQLNTLYLSNSTLPNLRLVEVITPSGSPGLVDVTLTAGQSSATAAKAFQYAQTSKIFPFSTSPSFLLYDSLRQKLYASHTNQVEVIDPIAQQVLTPLVPASGKLANSQFAGLSLSPDGNRLYIADTGANLIHMLDLTHPGTGTDINPATALGSSSPISPGRVFETASGKLVGSNVNEDTFVIDGLSGGGTALTSGYAWNSTNKGEHIFISRDGNGLIWSQVGLWNDATSEYLGTTSLVSLTDETQWIVEAAANEDGTVIAAGGSTPGVIDSNPEIVDFDLHTMGLIEEHFDTPMPAGTPSFFLHPSGALLYKAGEVLLTEGITPFGGLVEIDDVHQFQPAATVVFPEPFITSYSPYTNHLLTTDDTGRYFFGVTQSGITMMVLNTIPLSIGNLQPSFGQPGGGQTITIRGSGFLTGASASFGGVQAATTYVDADTLTATVPPLTAGWQDVTVANTNGISYTAHGIFQVLSAPPTPVIMGFSPATFFVGSDIPGFDTSAAITILGSGFEAYDTVEVSGLLVDSAFVDAAHIQATVPENLTGATGLLPFTVVSPYTGASNTLSLPMVNPAPVIDYSAPPHLVTETDGTSLWVNGTGFVAGSVVQWNGQGLSGGLVGGEGANGDETIISAVPANLLTGTGTATLTVFNPGPGGGTSNAVNLDLSSTYPQMSFPASVDFGEVVMNVAATQTVQLTNTGSANYKLGSVTAGSGPFSVQASGCGNVPPQSSCNLQVQFLPTAAGAATGTMTIADNSIASPHTIPLTGTGMPSLVPTVAITSIDVLGQTVQATVNGTATVGGSAVPAIAWIEYGTDQTLTTNTQTAQWGFSGDSTLSRVLYSLSPSTTYAVRLFVQTANGTGQSSIRLFATMASPPVLAMGPATGGSSTVTVTPGQTATFLLAATDGGNGYTGTATLSCGGAPYEATCTVSPSTVSVGLNATPFTVTVTTTAASSALLKSPPGGSLWALALLLAAAALTFPRRRHRLSRLVCLAGLLIIFSACGGGGSSTSGPAPAPNPGTPAGTYGLTITGTTGGVQSTYVVMLTVN